MASYLNKFSILLLLGLYIPILFLGIFDLDEGAFASSSLQMLRDNQYLIPYLGDDLRLEKPIFTYWVQTFSMTLFGATEFALRIPSIIASLIWGISFASFVRKHDNKISKTSIFLNLLTLPGVFIISFAATADAFLNLFITLALINLFDYSQKPSNRNILKVSFYIALGFLTKGLTIIAICGPVIFLFLLTQSKLKVFFKMLLNWRPWILFLVLVAPWLYLVSQQIEEVDLSYLFLGQTFGRFTQTFENHTGPFYYYLLVLPILILPYLFDFLRGVRNLQIRANQLDSFMLIWFLFVLIFFSFSSTKLPHYVLYGISPVAYVVTKQHLRDRNISVSLSFWLFSIIIWVLLSVLPQILSYLNEVKINYEVSDIVLHDFSSDVVFVSVCFVMALFSSYYFFAKKSSNNLKRATAIAMVGLISIKILPYVHDASQGDIKKLGLQAREFEEPISMYKLNKPSFSFYAQKNSLRGLESSELIFTRTDKIKYLELEYEVISTSGNYMILRLKND